MKKVIVSCLFVIALSFLCGAKYQAGILIDITEPSQNQIFDNQHGTVSVSGVIKELTANLRYYEVFYAKGHISNPRIPIAIRNSEEVDGGTIASWPIGGLTPDRYWIFVVASDDQGNQQEDYVKIQVVDYTSNFGLQSNLFFNNEDLQVSNNFFAEFTSDADGTKIVYTRVQGPNNNDVFVYDFLTNQTTQITSDTFDQRYPRISGDTVVWQDDRDGQFNLNIYSYDLTTSTETQITFDTSSQRNPDIYGDMIVWQDFRNGDWDLYFYDMTQGIVSPLIVANGNQVGVRIHGDSVVWEDDRNVNTGIDIYHYDLNSLMETQITTNPSRQDNPDISDSLIVWSDLRNGGNTNQRDVYAFDLNTGIEVQITNDQDSQGNPKVSDGSILYDDTRTSDSCIYYYDYQSQLEDVVTCVSGVNQMLPVSSGLLIAWTRFSSFGGPNVYAKSIVSTPGTANINFPDFIRKPTLSGPKVVWYGLSSNIYNILGFDFGHYQPFTVANNTVNQSSLFFWGDGVVWEESGDIFLKDLRNGVARNIVIFPSNQENPFYRNTLVAYEDDRNGNKDIRIHNMITGDDYAVTNDSSDQLKPVLTMDAKWVLYYSKQNNPLHGDLYGTDLRTMTEHLLVPGPLGSFVDILDPVSTSGKYVVLTKLTGPTASQEVYLYDLETGNMQLLSNPVDLAAHIAPVIDGNLVAWYNTVSNPNDWDISVYDLRTGTTHSTNVLAPYARSPYISGRNFIWLSDLGIRSFQVDE